jgi:hypothetical protein
VAAAAGSYKLTTRCARRPTLLVLCLCTLPAPRLLDDGVLVLVPLPAACNLSLFAPDAVPSSCLRRDARISAAELADEDRDSNHCLSSGSKAAVVASRARRKSALLTLQKGKENIRLQLAGTLGNWKLGKHTPMPCCGRCWALRAGFKQATPGLKVRRQFAPAVPWQRCFCSLFVVCKEAVEDLKDSVRSQTRDLLEKTQRPVSHQSRNVDIPG